MTTWLPHTPQIKPPAKPLQLPNPIILPQQSFISSMPHNTHPFPSFKLTFGYPTTSTVRDLPHPNIEHILSIGPLRPPPIVYNVKLPTISWKGILWGCAGLAAAFCLYEILDLVVMVCWDTIEDRRRRRELEERLNMLGEEGERKRETFRGIWGENWPR